MKVMKNMIDLCVVGDLHWLIVLSTPPREGTGVKNIERLLGNDAAIVSILATRLGLSCHLLTTNAIAVCDGQPLIDILQQEGVDISLVDTGGVTTPTTFLILNVDSDERVLLADDYAFRNLTSDPLPASKFAYIDFYEGHAEERLALIQKWSQANVHCLVNLSASYIEEKAKLLTRIPSVDTLQIGGNWSVDESRIRGSHILQMCNARAVVITLGSLGTVLVDQHNDYYIPAEPIQPLRTIGAGASFAAGFLSALAQNATYKDAAIFANRYAAIFCTLEKNPLDAMKR
jgi:sugar/nucleoside kinase (ribokinase family)